jgi:hypothetical protein
MHLVLPREARPLTHWCFVPACEYGSDGYRLCDW